MPHPIDLQTKYLGLTLGNPIVAAACSSNRNPETVQQLVQAGIAAIVLPSLFEEQIEHDEWQFTQLPEYGAESFAEAASYFPALDSYNTGPDDYLEAVRRTVDAVPVPVIGSLNGVTRGGWTEFAQKIQDAGAAALELNMYNLPTDPSVTASQIEQNYLDLVAEVRRQVSIPLAVKIGPFFSAPANFARRLIDAGADGLVLFNRFMQPDIDLDRMVIDPRLDLSHSWEIRLPLRWIAILRGQVDVSLAATSGIHSMRDVVKMLLVGADVTMLASAILTRGPDVIGLLLRELEDWLQEHGYRSVSQLRGSMSYVNCPNPGALERGNYMKALTSYTSPYV
ncbi:MAG: dihydroorotate dehydrogenase-like protein [Planctomycetaceae bacterium]|nr:dihydroorotate dehydrogenase-like protein [Planctomycetaceae bacterium]